MAFRFLTTPSPSEVFQTNLPALFNHFFHTTKHGPLPLVTRDLKEVGSTSPKSQVNFVHESESRMKPVSTFLLFTTSISAHSLLFFVLFPEINHETQKMRFIFTNSFEFCRCSPEEHVIPTTSSEQIVSPFFPFEPNNFSSYFLHVLNFVANKNSNILVPPTIEGKTFFQNKPITDLVNHSFTVPSRSDPISLKFLPLQSPFATQPFVHKVFIPIFISKDKTKTKTASFFTVSNTNFYFEHYSLSPTPSQQQQQPTKTTDLKHKQLPAPLKISSPILKKQTKTLFH